MARTVLGMRGNGALRVRLLPLSQAGAASAATRVSGTGADKHATLAVDAARLEHACAAVLCAVRFGRAVCEGDGLKTLKKTDVDGTPLQRLCVWRAALAVLEATGHVVRNGRWYTVRGAPRCDEAPRLTRGRCRLRAGCRRVLRAYGRRRGGRRAGAGERGGGAAARAARESAAAGWVYPRGAPPAARAGPRAAARAAAAARQDGAPSAQGARAAVAAVRDARLQFAPEGLTCRFCARRTEISPARSRASACRSSPTKTRNEGGSACGPVRSRSCRDAQTIDKCAESTKSACSCALCFAPRCPHHWRQLDQRAPICRRRSARCSADCTVRKWNWPSVSRRPSYDSTISASASASAPRCFSE